MQLSDSDMLRGDRSAGVLPGLRERAVREAITAFVTEVVWIGIGLGRECPPTGVPTPARRPFRSEVLRKARDGYRV